MSPVYRRVLKLSRIMHVYLTLFGLVLILFFSVTGFMLNYEAMFLPKLANRVTTTAARLDAKILDPVDKLAVVETLRRHHGVSGFLGGDPKEFDTEDDDHPPAVPMSQDMEVLFPIPKETDEPISLLFAAPGKRFEVKIWRKDQETKADDDGEDKKDAPKKKAGDVEIKRFHLGWGGIAMDLHKGKSSGLAWKWVINVTCGLLLVISITGLVLWSSLKTRGKWGGVLLLVGGLASFAVYYFGVP